MTAGKLEIYIGDGNCFMMNLYGLGVNDVMHDYGLGGGDRQRFAYERSKDTERRTPQKSSGHLPEVGQMPRYAMDAFSEGVSIAQQGSA